MRTIISLLTVMVLTGSLLAQEGVLDATDLEALRARVGVDAVVEGLVTEIGTTKDASITFVNIGLPKKQGFVALVFQKDYEAFPEGFDKYRNQKVRVKGLMKLYRGETPQIILTSPEQITVVTEAAAN